MKASSTIYLRVSENWEGEAPAEPELSELQAARQEPRPPRTRRILQFEFPNTLIYLGLTIVLFLSQVAVAQQNPHGQLPVTSVAQPYLLLIRDPIVHDDLALAAGQRRAVALLSDELDSTLWPMRNASGQHIDETMQKAAAAAKTRLSSVFTRDQQQRLWQIEMRVLGTRAFMHDDLPAKLELSPDQRQSIRATVTATQEAITGLKEQLHSGRSPESLRDEAQALRTDAHAQIVSTLTRHQQQEWMALLGKRIDIAKLGRVKFKAPDLAGQNGWINSSPLTLQQLRGKVVALHFYAFGCINCKRNFPSYRDWHTSFADHGLIVLGVHTPEVPRERNIDNVRREARNAGLTFPILVDNDRRNWEAWGNSMWPSVYLIDKQGYIRYWWYGELKWRGAAGDKLLRKRLEDLIVEKQPATESVR